MKTIALALWGTATLAVVASLLLNHHAAAPIAAIFLGLVTFIAYFSGAKKGNFIYFLFVVIYFLYSCIALYLALTDTFDVEVSRLSFLTLSVIVLVTSALTLLYLGIQKLWPESWLKSMCEILRGLFK